MSIALQNPFNGADEHNIEKNNNSKRDDLEDVQSVGSKHKGREDEYSFNYPVLGDLSSSMIVEAHENSRIVRSPFLPFSPSSFSPHPTIL
ncbi:hypothetical protein APHAL10511_006960 [Amanita phalloides]|nr:hypothetical protein APHAL10511_006960 [Amanita phalloides]